MRCLNITINLIRRFGRLAAWQHHFGCLLLIIVMLAVAAPAQAGSSFKVGNFGKSQASAPAIQVIAHGLGETPKALILWTAGGITRNFTFGLGFTDGTTQRSVSSSSQDQRASANAGSRIANKALTIAEWGTVTAEADLASWDSTNFTLNWTTNNPAATTLHFIAIGGSDISAKVVEWTMPASTGNTSVTGVGFESDVVINAFARLSSSEAHGISGVGVMDADGDQWANSVYTRDSSATMDTQRGQKTNVCIHAIDTDLTVLREASWVSMDSDGFTVNFTTSPAWTNNAISLALKGLNAQAGSFSKSTSTSIPVSQPVTGTQFEPNVVILSSFQDIAQANPVAHTLFGFGASDGSTEGCSAFRDTDALTQSDNSSSDQTSKVFVKTNYSTGSAEAAADLSSMDSDGFTLSWTTNDTVAAQILYLALSPMTATLADHAAGQETDKFGPESSVNGAELFAFKLTNEGDSTMTVDEIIFTLSSVTGIVQGDFSNLEIYVDDDNDGTIEAGETTKVGGTGTVDAGVTTITFGTNFNISASTTVNYILKGDVSNLVKDDTVSISLEPSDVTLLSGSVSGSTTNVNHTADAAATLADHAAGQEENKFADVTSISGAELFAFKLTNERSTVLAVDEIIFSLSSVTGIVQGDFSNLEIYVDDDNDGTIEAGETTKVGGTGTVDAGVTTITFGTNFNISASTTVNYILVGDVDNLTEGDTVTISLGTSGVTLTSGTVGGSDTTEATHTTCTGSYQHRKKLTIDAARIGSSCSGDISTFPVLVSLEDDNDLKTHVESADGYDIIFRWDDGTCVNGNPCKGLGHEIEEWDASTGTLVAWVNIPTVDFNEDTEIFIYYGNSCITTDYSNPSDVWDSNFKGVWHLPEDQSGTGTIDLYEDSTSYNNHGDDEVSATGKDGQINGGQGLDGTDDNIPIGDTSGTDDCFVFGSWTLEFWLNPSSPDDDEGLFIQGSDGCASRQLKAYWHTDHLEVRTATDGSSGTPQAATSAIVDSAWSHFVWTYNGSTHTLYVDGQTSAGATAGSNVGIEDENFIGTGGSGAPEVKTFSFASDPSNTSISGNKPTGTVEGDLLIAIMATDGARTLSPPDASWTAITNNIGTGHTSRSWYKIASASEPSSYTFSVSSSEAITLGILRISGHNPTDPIDVYDTNTGTSTSPTAPSIATTVNNALILRYYGADDDDYTGDDAGYPSGHTGIYRRQSGGVNNECHQGAAYTTQASTGSTGTAAFTQDAGEEWSAVTIAIAPAPPYWTGGMDEVRISSTARDACWIETEYNSHNDPTKDAACTDNGFICVGNEEVGPPTVVSLLSFTATGNGNNILVDWQTAQELSNFGFHLYRATSPTGPFAKLNASLIAGLSLSAEGKSYSFVDTNVTVGQLYYYKLEDIDVHDIRTFHGPICVDWDGDGLPDDWEIGFGLNPWVNDADIDTDGDGLTNLEEYQLNTDPFNPDTDGDGILDGDESRKVDRKDSPGTRQLSRGVEVIAEDETGITLELSTESFDTELLEAGGMEFERLRIGDYIHGHTNEVGYPEVPLKGILVDIPEGKLSELSILQTVIETHSGYQVFPVPEPAVDDQGAAAAVAESFILNKAAYEADAFYPQVVAKLGEVFVFRAQQKQQLLFYPITFNPVTGDLRHYKRIRVRIEYGDDYWAMSEGISTRPWRVPKQNSLSDTLSSMGSIAMAFGASPLIVNPLSSALSSLGVIISAVWAPPTGLEATAYKILVSEEGIYRLSRDYLNTNSVDVDTIDLSVVRMYNLGQEIALEVYDQNGDNYLDATDYIQFYGQPAAEQYAKYSKYNVYWLSLNGASGSPKRMATVDGTPASGADPGTHVTTVHYEQDQYYWLSAPGTDELDRWFSADFVIGDGIDFPGAGDPVDFAVFLPGVGGQGTLKISILGTYDTDHLVNVWLNDTFLGIFTWSSLAFYQATIEAVDLLEGDNTVTVQCASSTDLILLDWIEVTYPRNFSVNNDTLKFTHDPGYRFQVAGFTTNELSVFDITDPGDVSQGVNFETTGTGPYSLDFEPPPEPGSSKTYLTVASNAVKTPVTLTEDDPSSLADTANGADYVLITHKDLGWDGNSDRHPWLDDLVALRESQGLRVKVVDVADIFDEFSYGMITPEAIRDFLSYAYTSWSPPSVQYVLFVGDSTYDYKDNWGLGQINYVPSYLIFTEYMGETATDEWFGRISGDDAVSDLYIGRLPAASANEASIMVDKILSYESILNTKSWEKNILFIADDQTEAYEAVFETMNDDAAAMIPAGLNAPFKGYLNDYLVAADLTAEIKTKINAGNLIVNYSGHGAVQIWANESIFENTDIATLTNDGMYPFFISMSCLTGHFIYPEAWGYPSMAEVLLRSANKGAAAALMPTGMTTTAGQHILNTALFEAIFTEDIRALGPAVAAAKQTLLANGDSAYQEDSETFLLFGDPAMVLKVPLPRRPSGLTAVGQDAGVMLQWNGAADSNDGPVAGYNLYRSTSPGASFSLLNTGLTTETQYLDTDAADGKTYYYVVTSVDADGDESVQSQQISASTEQISASTGMVSSGSSGAGGCFINSTSGYSLRENRAAEEIVQIACIDALLFLGAIVGFLFAYRKNLV